MPKFPFRWFKRRPNVVRDVEDVAQLRQPLLGSIPEFEAGFDGCLPDEAYPEALEAYRGLVNGVSLPDFHLRGRVIVVTGASRGAGTSTVAKNLATLLARGGGKAILADVNLDHMERRRPGDGTSSSGFAGLLVNQLMRPGKALVHTLDPRLKLLPAGSYTGSQGALMRSTRLPRVVDGLRELADYVIFDVAPVAEEMTHLTHLADVTLVVAWSGKTSREDAAWAVRTLEAANVGAMGMVLNRTAVEAAVAAPSKEIAAVDAPVEAEERPEPGKRLEIAVEELLADLEAAVSLIRDLRLANADEDEPPEDGPPEEEKTAELVAMDR
jgi:Mrp family chromosome partitioning ATPase